MSGDLTDDGEPKRIKRLFAPNGNCVIDCYVTCLTRENVVLDAEGKITGTDSDKYPGTETVFIEELSAYFVTDSDGTEFLSTHCRVIDCDAEDDEWTMKIDPWDDAIVAACDRAQVWAWRLHELEQFRRTLPEEVIDPTMRVALDTILKPRLMGPLDAALAMISAYCADRVEITTFEEAPCATCREHREESGDLRRAMPCDECGTLDEEDDDG